MLGVGLNLKPRFIGGQAVVGYYTLGSSAYVSEIVIAKPSDTDEIKQVYKLIPVFEQQAAGTYPIVWDGLDYEGNTISSDYKAYVVTSNITYDYYILGSNATTKHGTGCFRGYSPNVGIFFASNKVYFNHSWDEGQNIKGAYVDKSVDIKTQINLGYGGNTKFSGPAFEFGCKVPGKDIVILGGENSAQGYEGDNIVYAYNSSTDAALTFANGSTYNGGLTTYSVLYQGSEKISGITASNGFCYVTFAATNTVRIYRIGTVGSPDGTLEDTKTTTTINASWSNPIVFAQSFDDSTHGERIWAMNKSTSQVFMLSVNGTTGAITYGTLTMNFGLGYKVSLAVNNSNHTIAFIIGAGYQQIRFFDISAANPSTSAFQTWGTAGGMEAGNTDCAVVTNTKFGFWDNSTGIDKGTPRGYIGWSDDGEFWIGDTSNRRTLRFTWTYSSTYTFTYVDQVDQIGAVYNPNINMNNATECYIMGMRYTIDLDTGGYTLTHNYLPQMSVDNVNGRDMINFVSSLSTEDGVKRMAIINDYSTTPPTFPLVELTDDGIVATAVTNMADTGTYIGSVNEDFTMFRIDAASYSVGQPYNLDHKDLSYSGGVWSKSAWITDASGTIEAGDTQSESGNTSYYGKIGNGSFAFANFDKDGNTNYMIELSNSSGVKKVRSVQRTTKVNEGGAGYTGSQGQIPPPAWFEVGNGVNDIAYKLVTLGDFWFTSANYEDFKGKQGNYCYIGYKNGSPIKLLGTNRWKTEAYEDHAVEADGNCQFFHVSRHDSDTIVGNFSSEGGQAGSQIRVMKGFASISIKACNIVAPISPIVRGTRQLLELSAVDIFSNTTYLNLSEVQSADFKVETNIMWPDREKPDLHIYSTAGGNHTRYVRDTIHPTRNASMKHWELAFDVNFMGHSAAESTSFPGAFVRVLDNSSKIIALIGVGVVGFTYSVFANNTVIFTTTDLNDLNNYLFDFNSGYIKTNSLGCEISFGNEDTIFVDYVDPTCTWNYPTSIDVGCQTKTGGTGMGSISVKQELDYYDTITADAAPTISSFETFTGTKLRVTSNQAINLNASGWTLKANGSTVAINSVTKIAPNIWDLNNDGIAYGQTVTISYNSATGSTLNADNVELVSFTDVSVTNTVPNASLTRGANISVIGSGTVIDVDLPSFNCIAGNPMLLFTRIPTFLNVNEISDTAGNTLSGGDWVLDKTYSSSMGFRVYRCQNPLGNANNVVNVQYTGYNYKPTAFLIQNGGTLGALDTTAEGVSAGSNSVTSSAYTTGQANTYAIMFVSDDYGGQVWTTPIGWTLRVADGDDAGSIFDRTYSSIQSSKTETVTSANNPDNKQIVVLTYNY